MRAYVQQFLANKTINHTLKYIQLAELVADDECRCSDMNAQVSGLVGPARIEPTILNTASENDFY
ncbi:hypothetical protein ACFL0D_00275 [Thermoproteota archaeon]